MNHHPRSKFLRIMVERGYLDNCSNLAGLDQRMSAGPVTAYIGFDATATSLHAGSLIQIMMLKWLQETGHRPIVLMGGGTTRIGDPSFRSSERPVLDENQINHNIDGIRRIFSRYLSFGNGPGEALLANNDEWLGRLNYIDFLRDIGRHFSVNRMLSFESVKSRLDREQSLSFLEFNYMILQAYDFLELYRRHDCLMQMGGSDQWGNILNGVDLVRRIESNQVFALTSPLLTTADGKKMGKSASGAVWLNPENLPAFDFWQYWRNVHDEDVGRFLKLFTMMDLEECEELGRQDGNAINEAKIILANTVTVMAHGRAEASRAAEAANAIFVQGRTGDAIPTRTVDRRDMFDQMLSITRALVQAGLAPSGKEARRRLQEGSVRLDDEVVRDTSRTISLDELQTGAILAVGKKRYVRLILEE